MNRLFILTLFAFFSCTVFAQDTLNLKDSQGRRQGSWRKIDSAGKMIYEGHFKDGVPEGEFRYYYPNGKVKMISMVSGQGRRAATISFFPSGMKMAIGTYINEKKDSTWQFFSEVGGNLVSEETYKAGLVNGVSKVYNPEGGLTEIQYYKDGVKDGKWEQYYLDGKLKIRGTYRGGDKVGAFTSFYNSGQTMTAGQYNQGHQDGTWVHYNEKGAVSKKEVFDFGELIKVEEPGK
jgi:antitoxin component YwqK of YwqJK toxin-antitoxin module